MRPIDLPEEARQLAAFAGDVMRRVGEARMSIAAAESCTGGLLASLLTDLPGLSGAFERGFVTYSERSKCELLGIDPVEIERHGVVSAQIAALMADGAIRHSGASLAVGITGYAGPGGDQKVPGLKNGGEEAGLVHLAARRRGGRLICRKCHYGDIGRDRVRMLAARAALEMIGELVDEARGPGA